MMMSGEQPVSATLYQLYTLSDVRSGPILLQCDRRGPNFDFTGWERLPAHIDEEQVQLDVNRSFVYYPECKSSIHLFWRLVMSNLTRL